MKHVEKTVMRAAETDRYWLIYSHTHHWDDFDIRDFSAEHEVMAYIQKEHIVLYFIFHGVLLYEGAP